MVWMGAEGGRLTRRILRDSLLVPWRRSCFRSVCLQRGVVQRLAKVVQAHNCWSEL